MVALQEELDWSAYRTYGLLDDSWTHCTDYVDLPTLQKGERAFEIMLARKLSRGESKTAWFRRHNSTPITDLPAHWPEAYRQIVQRRIELIESNPYIRLIEQPEYKRRWSQEPWEERLHAALHSWLLDRLETPACWPSEPTLTTCARLADIARRDGDFMQVAELYRGRADFDVTALVSELVASEAVPYLPVLRYTESGMRKRAQWGATWDLQRQEDAAPPSIERGGRGVGGSHNVGKIPVPPKYTSTDFQKADCWRLRGKLDVPKERFVSYPLAQRDTDPTMVITWAGYDALQQATALASYYITCRENEGWSPERLQPLLCGLYELIPWLLQWHNEVDPNTGERLGTFYEGFAEQERRTLGFTREEIRNWRPPEYAGGGRKRKAKRK